MGSKAEEVSDDSEAEQMDRDRGGSVIAYFSPYIPS